MSPITPESDLMPIYSTSCIINDLVNETTHCKNYHYSQNDPIYDIYINSFCKNRSNFLLHTIQNYLAHEQIF